MRGLGINRAIMLRVRNPFVACALALLTMPTFAQGKRLWVLRATGEMIEYDPATFTGKDTIKIPLEIAKTPQSISINHLGQMLSAPAVSLPLAETDVGPHKAWIWNGHTSATIDLGVKREVGTAGSNQAVTESAPSVYLSADGAHLFWFANQARRLQREEFDLSTQTAWQAWRTDLNGAAREDLAAEKLPDCRCPTGSCEESCPYGVVWAPEGGIDKYFFLTQFVTGKTGAEYRATTRYEDEAGKWTPAAQPEPLKRLLDSASGGNIVIEAIPDTSCCGWSNQSDDQTVVHVSGKIRTVFDERTAYKNPDYDVSFYTANAKLSPEWGYVATTITATAQANQPIQLAQEGQANPEESKQIRKALAELPAVEVTNSREIPGRVAFLQHASLVGWISEKELLIVEDHVLVTYDVLTGARRKSTVKIDDPSRVFLR
jgi:hypothetical protein